VKKGLTAAVYVLTIILLFLEVKADITTCGNVTTSDNLTQNITCTGSALKIIASNVELDCAGYTIIGDGTGNAIQAEDVNNITIRNCNINSFNISIAFLNSSAGQIYNITSKNMSKIGIEIDANSVNNNLQNITIDENNHTQFRAAILLEGNNNSLRNVSALTESSSGMELLGSNNLIINSTFGSVNDYGILMNGTASGNLIQDIYCNSVNFYSLALQGNNTNNSFTNLNCQGTNGVIMESQASFNSIYNSTINVTGDAVNILSNEITIKDSILISGVTALETVSSGGVYERNQMYSETSTTLINLGRNQSFINNTIFSEWSVAVQVFYNDSIFIGNNITSNASYAIESYGYNLIYDSNKISSFLSGLYFVTGGNITVANNEVNSTGDSIDFEPGVDGNIITGNNCSSLTAAGLDVPSENNNVANNRCYSVSGYGIEVRGDYNNVSNNFGISGFVGLFVEGSNNYFYNNTGHSNDSYGIVLQNSYDNLFIDTIGIVDYNATLAYPPCALGFAVGTGNNTFVNTLAKAPNARALWLSEVFGDTQNNTFINITLESNYTWIISDSTSINNSFKGLTFKSSTGNITILENLTLPNSVNVTIDDISLGQSYAFINSKNLTFFNKSAEIFFNGINYSNPQILADYDDNGTFVICNAPECNITSYIGGVLEFRVSHFTNYTVQEANSTTCGNVNQSLTLSQSLDAMGTCLSITADNLIIDCNGHNITYAGNETGYGINATGRNNITIQNCNLYQNISNQTSSHSLYFIEVNNSRIINTTAKTTGLSSMSVLLGNSHNNIVEKTFVNPIGKGSALEAGIRFFQSNNNTIKDVNVMAETDAKGIDVELSNQTTIIYSNITSAEAPIIISFGENFTINNTITNSTVNRGIQVYTSLNAQIYNNYAFGGIFLSGLNDSVLINNTAEATLVPGFELATVSNTLFDSNRGSADIGFSLTTDSINNTFKNNILEGINFGLLLVNSYSNSFQNTTINGTETSSGFIIQPAGIVFFGFGQIAQNNTFNNTIINAPNALFFGGLFGGGSENNSLINTVINSNTTWISSDSTAIGNSIQNTTFSTPQTKVIFNQNITIPNDANLTFEVFNVSYNKVFLNSTNASFLNLTAKIIFTNLTTPSTVALIDESDNGTFVECPTTICQNITTGTTFTMDVAHFTTYSTTSGGISLTLEKTDSQDPVNPGSQLNYTININVTSGTAVNLTLTELYPSDVVFDSAVPAPTSGNNTWAIGNLTSGQSYQINIKVNVSSTASGIITNTVNITYQNSTNDTLSASVQENTTINSLITPQTSSGGGGGSSSAICPPFCRYPENKNLPVCRNNCVSETPTQISYPSLSTKNNLKQEKTEIEQSIEEKVEEKVEKKAEEIKQEIPQTKYKLPDNLLYYVFFAMAGLGVLILLIIGAKRDKKENKKKRK